MKKNLLLMAAIVGSSLTAMAQVTETDITPSGYNWGETGVLPTISTTFVQKANPDAPAFDSYDGSTQYNNGLVGIDGNAAATYGCVTSGMSIVDFGGEVGKVLAIRGAACSNVETDLKAATGMDYSIPQMSAATTWFNLNFFSDPNNTPTSSSKGDELPSDAYIHVKLVLNVYTDDQTGAQEEDANPCIKSVYAVGNQNNLKPAGGVGGTAIDAYKFFVTETEGEYAGLPAYDENDNAKWDPTRWMVMEFDTWCPEPDANGTTYTPLRIKLTGNGWANFSTETLFLKEVSFTKCVGTPETSNTTTPSITYETLTVGDGSATGINSATLTPASNGAKYSLDGKRVNDDYKGVVIENGSKSIVR